MPLRLESSEFDVELFSLSKEGALPYIGPAKIVPVMLDAEGVARLTRPWLKHCQEKHPKCNQSSKTRQSGGPRRLVRLLPDGKLQLVLAAGINAPYTALSYCWGTGSNYTTTVDTLSSRMESLEYRNLPKTIRDAIDITRRLDIEYIWIDSICIIQDDEQGVDWREESANMDTIYEGALLTLSATRSSSVELGFIGNREKPGPRDSGKSKAKVYEENLASTRLLYNDPNGNAVEVLVRHRLPHDAIIPEDADTSQYPLLARGWTFQERLLATRTIHFLPQEIIWECRCEFWCECGSSRADLAWTRVDERGFPYGKEINNPDAMKSTLLWQSLVEQYSKRVLSLQSDRLPALSGVARRIRHADPTVGSYLAGLWHKDLLWHLLWQVDHAQIPIDSHHYLSQNQNRLVGSFCDASALQRRSREPTWSWISTSWPVKWFSASPEIFRSHRPSASFREAQCVVDPINPLGDVSSGKITLTASITQTELSTYHDDSWKLVKNTQQGMSKALEVIFIPDGTFNELSLVAGDIVHCAKILEYTKDNDIVWVALGLRRLDAVAESKYTDNSETATVTKQKDRKCLKGKRTEDLESQIGPNNMKLWLRLEKAIANMGDTNSDIQRRWRALNEQADNLRWETNVTKNSLIQRFWMRDFDEQAAKLRLELKIMDAPDAPQFRLRPRLSMTHYRQWWNERKELRIMRDKEREERQEEERYWRRGGKEMILKGLTGMERIISQFHHLAKVQDNNRPTHSAYRSSSTSEKVETYYRVGIVTGKVRARSRAQGLPASLDWFRGAEERAIDII
ncbi:hypothetical protein CkaCkLH20_09706 [Colletotrichum karsti]|uniref:Heterokaryon incompatibility domain-containing protein n=1 Tax=Colletotrichum karsti TaxID=1095194 RepID=A0A9P6HWN0_9PEZI|nr:uncharacterized protein CkaCkLH20_09706 [Colletotrichum karsti]KAF9872843.1 hypothetical protein CkaCkLH20_09706 [Colletotrichum karsti]